MVRICQGEFMPQAGVGPFEVSALVRPPRSVNALSILISTFSRSSALQGSTVRSSNEHQWFLVTGDALPLILSKYNTGVMQRVASMRGFCLVT